MEDQQHSETAGDPKHSDTNASEDATGQPSITEFQPPGRRNSSQLEWLLPLLFCAILLAQLFLSINQLSQTVDEATHLYSGYRYLKCGDLTVSPEHPPLAKSLEAAPLLGLNVPVNCAPFHGDALFQAFTALDWLFRQNWATALSLAHFVAAIFSLGLCFIVWIAARHMFGFSAAVVACTLLIFEPNILSYGMLVGTDIPVTCLFCLTIVAFYFWTKHRTIGLLLLTGASAGFTLLAKTSGIVVLPVLGVLAIADVLTPPAAGAPANGSQKPQSILQSARSFALVCVLAIGVLWLGYGLRFAPYPGATDIPSASASASSATGRVISALETYHLLPKAYLQGFGGALEVAGQISVAFVAGKIYPNAPWFSTGFNFLIRNTPAMLALITVSLVGLAITFRQQLRERLFLIIPAIIYLAVCLHESRDVSIRYLLPTLPFLLILVAAGCIELAKRSRVITYALPCLLALHAASALHAYPNYLSYASELWGGPRQAYRFLPGLDFGQAYPQAKAYLEQHAVGNCWFLTAWQWDPKIYDIPCQTFGLYLPNQIPPRVRGTVIVSSTLLRDVRLAESGIAASFRNATPKAEIGGSALLVYEGDFDTSTAAAAGESNLAMQAVSTGQSSAALEHAENALRLAPANPLVHVNMCRLLASTQVDRALRECSIARYLLLSDPFRHEITRQKYLELLQGSITSLESAYRQQYQQEPKLIESSVTH